MFEERKTKSVLFISGANSCKATAWEPRADIYKVDDGWLVKFDLAGVRMEDLEVTLAAPNLTVQGVRRDRVVQETRSCYSLEITYSRFYRSLLLPELDGQSSLSLEYRDGLLLVWITKAK